ncbi:hypothetical protein GOBAR_AA03138 [Gossypium barbadense]|uniref:Bifunctional inhibitor/plant lipid transfer protein/seed storage helical domain-containing protein n=1 Tax=Gossypium barbadense TaxID=3634 RepID=A0A2P5YPA4_GOSBA|nr:hypothetical protein GOBAR_AA03138 [Gossypium barbadense]
MTCLSFAQGKMEKPSKECCSSVSSIKEEEPKCLCYILQQTQASGAQNLKSLGVQQDKLLQLPSACQLKNASVTDCPKLLGLAPNSPDAAIFTNSSSTPTTPSTGTPSSASENADNNSGGTKLETAHLLHLQHDFTILVLTFLTSIIIFRGDVNSRSTATVGVSIGDRRSIDFCPYGLDFLERCPNPSKTQEMFEAKNASRPLAAVWLAWFRSVLLLLVGATLSLFRSSNHLLDLAIRT